MRSDFSSDYYTIAATPFRPLGPVKNVYRKRKTAFLDLDFSIRRKKLS